MIIIINFRFKAIVSESESNNNWSEKSCEAIVSGSGPEIVALATCLLQGLAVCSISNPEVDLHSCH